MKIQTIEIANFKAIDRQFADFGGCSAIVTAGNNKGKSTLLRGLIDRFRGEKPEIILKEGETKGCSVMELTDGSKIEWKFTAKTESFSFTTSDGLVITKGVLSTIGEKYFGIKFDIDKFLNSTPKTQGKMVGALVGLDLTEIDEKYKKAYSKRTDANKELARLKGLKLLAPLEIIKPDIDGLKGKLNEIKEGNKKLTDKWVSDNKIHQDKIIEHNRVQTEKRVNYNYANDASDKLRSLGYTSEDLDKFVLGLAPGKAKEVTSIDEPNIVCTSELEQQIEDANNQLRNFDEYQRDLNEYNSWVKDGQQAAKNAKELDEEVKAIEAEKLAMISKSKVPSEFEFTEDGITYKGFPLSNAQLSSSAKYIAALKLGLMSLGDIKAMHFDASFLDNNSLSEIQEWADENDLQLLIERPDFDGGEITYKIV